jgi:uncharacterized protein Usg
MRPEKEEYYSRATSRLMRKLEGMGLSKEELHKAKRFTLLFRNSFKNRDVKLATFAPDLDGDIDVFTYDADGFCKSSSYAFSKLMGDKDWQLMYINEIWTYGPHHYLMHMPTKTVFDLTADQYTHSGIEVAYYLGRPIKLNKHENQSALRFAQALGLDLKQNG